MRARDVFVVQSTCAPTNENLMELLIMVDALKRASAERITRRDSLLRLCAPGPPPALHAACRSRAKVVANMLQTVGVDRVLTMDLHADQIQGFFDIPVDNIYASPVLLADLRQQELRRPDRGLARRRRRGARPRAGQAARLRPGHHRQAPPEGQRVAK